MAMVCPECKSSFKHHLDCPRCKVRLVFPNQTLAQEEEGPWQQTPWGRILAGLLLAQGLVYGLQHCVTAWWLANGEKPGATWSTLSGEFLLLAVQGLSLLLAGIVTSAGKTRGVLYATFVGLVNGLIFSLASLTQENLPSEVMLYGQPIWNLLFGGIGGYIGILCWKPLPSVTLLSLPSNGTLPVVRSREFSAAWILEGPVSWMQVLAGVAVVIAGVVGSQKILEFILEASGGKMVITTHFQAQMAIWEIMALVTLLGSGLAGASTINGLKQGFLVGLGSSVILGGINLGNPQFSLEKIGTLLIGTFIMSTVGGWFGSQLLPPLVPRRKVGSPY